MVELKGWAGVAAAALALAVFASPAAAKPVVKTKYVYYPVSGVDAASLHEAMVRRGPHVDGENAYAATEVTASQDGLLEQVGGSCRIQSYELTLDFRIRLPKLKASAKLSPDVRKRWTTFESFVRKHEDMHRQIWIGCAADLERKIKTIRTRDCDRAKVLAQAAMDKAWAACGKKHDAFDAAQRHPLMRQPFIQSVAGSATRTVTLKTPRSNFSGGAQ
jgi:predicted secreted Zn-dependent protease